MNCVEAAKRGVGGSVSRAGLQDEDASGRTPVSGDVPRLAVRSRAVLSEHH